MSNRADRSAGRVGVVTVAYRSDHVLPGLLDSLPDAIAEPFDVVIADNLPDEGENVQQLAAKHGARYVPLPSNPGYGAAINAAVAMLPSTVSWIVVTNPDVVCRTDSIAELIRAAAADDTIGAAGPAVENADGTVYPSARLIPSLRIGVGHALFASLWPTNPWTKAYRNADDVTGGRRDVGWLSGSCLVVRRSAFDAIGGFDAGYFMYFEDVDLGYRLGKAGFRNVYVPTARVLHTGAHSTHDDSARMVRAHHDSAKRFVVTKYHGWYLWPLRATLSLGLDFRARLLTRRVR